METQKQKGFVPIILLLIIIILLVVSLNTLTIIHTGSPVAIEPFNNRNSYILSEKVTYLFTTPKIGDAVIFTSSSNEGTSGLAPFLGIIIDIVQNKEIKTYKVLSTPGKPWEITADKIKERIYYPQVSSKLFQKAQSEASPTSAPTSTADLSGAESKDWKTYTNTQFNYTLSYPKAWTIQVKGNENPDTANGPILQSPCAYQSGDVCSSLQVDVQPDGTSKTLDDYASSLVNTLSSVRPDQLISKKHIVVDGQDAIEIEKYEDNYFYSSTDHGVVVISIITMQNGKIYYFTLLERRQDQANIKTSLDWKDKGIYYQILSTFKFLK